MAKFSNTNKTRYNKYNLEKKFNFYSFSWPPGPKTWPPSPPPGSWASWSPGSGRSWNFFFNFSFKWFRMNTRMPHRV